MARGRTKTVVALVFVAALLGGGAAGLFASRYLRHSTEVVVTGEASLSSELQLNKEQEAQIRRIWEQVRNQNQQSYQEGEALNQWRNDQVVKLLNEQQLKDFQKIHSEYEDRYTAMTSKRELAFRDAVAKTKQLLNARQRQEYEQILARRMGKPGTTEPQQDSTQPSPTFSASSVSGGVESPG